ncbi:unnamed protein product [Oppiella nova]|uniref:CNH domain-containing protein n=1 Tax=Oppiella nova TaxID=334625 RepID=A0A7R9LCK9_9ACAR|nr:unnamed protein product [Oppiella nova]CAG2162241.1 unnamed protein product [Oppiella nova]
MEIYKTIPIMKNLPLVIECICAFDDYIIIGTKQGHLLMYKLEIKYNQMNEIKPEIHLLRSNKAFAKKPIVQIEAVPDLRILVSLSDNVVSVHNLDQMTFPLITCVTKTRGASLFVLDVQRQRTLTGEHQCTLRMCVVVKYHLQLFYWKNNDFHELSADLKVPDLPKTIAWCSQSLCVGFRSDYSLIKVVTGEPKELFPTGDKPEPSVVLLEGNRLALGRDGKTYIMNAEGSPVLNYPITWSDTPLSLVDDSPYLVAVLPNNVVELLTVEPKVDIQREDLSDKLTTNRIKLIVKCANKRGHLLLASANDVFCMIRVPPEQQIYKLMAEHHFELALQVADMWTDSSEYEVIGGDEGLAPAGGAGITKKEQMMAKIKNMHAFDLFCKKQYKEALLLFLKLGTDPSQVIGLFPDLLPDDFRNKLEYPSKPPALVGHDLETGLFCLIDYLLEVRRNLANDKSVHNSAITSSTGSAGSSDNSAVVDGNASAKAKYQLKSIIDTTLLKCYLQTNDALVAPLLRLPDNRCHLEEVEKALKKHHKYNELIILYQNKGLHKNALDLLYKQSRKQDSPLAGYKRTVQYLQHMGAEHLELIFEYSGWVLKQHPEEGVKIFTDDMASDTELLPRHEVMLFLQQTNGDLLIPYLEHVIHVWNDTTPAFHNTLIHKYRERVRILLTDYKSTCAEGDESVGAGEEPGELGDLRRKLLTFLDESDHYSTETLPTYLLNDGLFEERAVVMGKIGNHKEALVIYVHMLHDTQRAEQYCQRMYDKGLDANKDVFLTLLDLYLSVPPLMPSKVAANPSLSKLEANIHVRGTGLYVHFFRCLLKTVFLTLLDLYLSVPPLMPSKVAANPSLSKLEANIQSAIQLLTKHSTKINALSVVKLLPASVPVLAIEEFLQSTTNHLLMERHSKQIFRNLLLAQHLQVQQQRIRLQQNKLVVDEHDSCRVCHKRIGLSVFVRFTNRDLVHIGCRDRYTSKELRHLAS